MKKPDRHDNLKREMRTRLKARSHGSKLHRHDHYPSMAQGKPRYSKASEQKPAFRLPRKRRYRGYMTKAVASVLIVAVLLTCIAAILLFALKDRNINNPALTAQIESSLQTILGDAYKVAIGETKIRLNSLSDLTVSSENVLVNKTSANEKLAEVNSVAVDIAPLSLLYGAPQINELKINGARIDLSSFLESSTAPDTLNLERLLQGFGKAVANLEARMKAGDLQSFRFSGITLEGLKLGRKNPEPFQINSGSLEIETPDHITAQMQVKTSLTNMKTGFQINSKENGARNVIFTAGPVNLREWINSPETGKDAEFGIGSDALVTVRGEIPFGSGGEPEQPLVRLSSGESLFRIGKKNNTAIDNLALNLRIIPELNQIEIERSTLNASGASAQFVGSIKPVLEEAGFKGPLAILFRWEKINGVSHNENEKILPVTALIKGNWDPATRFVAFDEILVETDGKQVTGSLNFEIPSRVEGVEPQSGAVTGTLTTTDFPTAAARQLWPFFMAHGARNWVGKNITGGSLHDVVADLNIPGGRITGLDNEIGFEPDELRITGIIEGVTVNTFGELPAISNASGSLAISGSSLRVLVEEGAATAPNGESLTLVSGEFAMDDFIDKDHTSRIDVVLDGSLATTALVANSKPLIVADRIKINPTSLTGKAQTAVAVSLDIKEGPKIENLAWRARTDLKDAGSKDKLFGRSIQNANLSIDATPSVIKANGTARIDNFPGNLEIVEPVGGNSPEKRVRRISASIDHKSLADIGIRVSPVIKGPMLISVSAEKPESNRISIDLTKVDLSLPWIGWLKGAGIPAKAEFDYSTSEGINRLDNFSVSGKGFDASGNLAFSKSGLVSASLKNVTLTGSEDFNVNVSRAKARYEIDISGNAYDGRALINKIIHEKGFASEKADIDVTLLASIGAVYGFNKRNLQNVSLTYRTDGGLLNLVELTGRLNGNAPASIRASKSGNETKFEMRSENAGSALGMVDIYRKMEGGTLSASLSRTGNGPFTGPVTLKQFTVTGEERLASLTSAPAADKKLAKVPGELQKLDTSSIKFRTARAYINKGDNFLSVTDGIIRSNSIGFTFEGDIFDQNNRMNVRGTFMPLIAVSRLVGLIPIVGQIFSNGQDSALLGITYRLRGPAKNPQIEVNPVSLVAPGIFNKVFEFQE